MEGARQTFESVAGNGLSHDNIFRAYIGTAEDNAKRFEEWIHRFVEESDPAPVPASLNTFYLSEAHRMIAFGFFLHCTLMPPPPVPIICETTSLVRLV